MEPCTLVFVVIHSTCRNYVVHVASVAVVGSVMSGQVEITSTAGGLAFSVRYLVCINGVMYEYLFCINV